MMYSEKFTLKIDPFVLVINSSVLEPSITVTSLVLGIAIAVTSLVLEIENAITVTYLVLEIEITFASVLFVLTPWLTGSIAVEDKEEREAEKPEGWF